MVEPSLSVSAILYYSPPKTSFSLPYLKQSTCKIRVHPHFPGRAQLQSALVDFSIRKFQFYRPYCITFREKFENFKYCSGVTHRVQVTTGLQVRKVLIWDSQWVMRCWLIASLLSRVLNHFLSIITCVERLMRINRGPRNSHLKNG